VDRIHAESQGYRYDQRDDDDQRRKDIHQAADYQQEDVQQQQKSVLAVDVLLHPIQQHHGYLGIDQIIGQSQGTGQNDQDTADQSHAFAHDGGHLAQPDIPVGEHLNNQDIRGGEWGRFHHSDHTAVNTAQHKYR